MDSLYTTTYIGNKPGAEDIYTHAETIDNIVIESAVLAGPVTFRNRNCNRNLGNCIMSELKVDKVSPRTGTYLAVGTLSYKNILINGDMSIAQRSTSVASITATGYNTLIDGITIQFHLELGHNHNQLTFQLDKVLQHL
jgi:hypothetical protein